MTRQRAANLTSLLVLGALLWLAATVTLAQENPADPTPADSPAPVLIAMPTPAPPTPTPSPTPEPVVIAGTVPAPLLVGGVEVERLPKNVEPGTKVCAKEGDYYRSEGERWTFQEWSGYSKQPCISPTKPGVYRPSYTHEVLVVVNSAVPAYQQSMWVPFGNPVSVEVPSLVEVGNDKNDRYRFVQWSEGQSPFQTSNTFAPVKPTTLEVKWAHERYVSVAGPDGSNVKGTGWYADGANVPLSAPETMPGSNPQERWKFDHWQGNGFPAAVIPNSQSLLTTLKADAAYSVSAVYTPQVLVDVRSPMGSIKRDWVTRGETVTIETPATADIVPDRERLIFRKWDGLDSIVSPKFSGPVDKPLLITAVYDRQYMLKVNAPYGVSGDGWQKAGSVATVTVPDAVSQMFLLRSTLAGITGFAGRESSVQIQMDEPKTLTALYRREVDVALVLELVIPVVLLVTALVLRRVWLRRDRRSAEPAIVAEPPAVDITAPAALPSRPTRGLPQSTKKRPTHGHDAHAGSGPIHPGMRP